MALSLAFGTLFSLQGAAVFTCAAALALIIYGLHPIQRYRYRSIPGPRFRWLVGGLPELASQGWEHAYAAWAERHAPHGVFKMFLGGSPHVVIVDPELSRKALKSSAHRYDPIVWATELEHGMKQHHMLFQSGPAWREMRNAWTPFFNTAKLQAYFPTMLRCTDNLLGVVAEAAEEGRVFDVWPVMATLTLSVIATVAGGVDVDVPADQFGIVSPHGKTLAEILAWAIRADIASRDPEADPGMLLLFLFPEARRLAEVVSRRFATAALREGREGRSFMLETFLAKLMAGLKQPQQDGSSTLPVNQESLLATMCSVKDRATGQLHPEMWVKMQSYLAIAAGHDTTSLALSYSIYLLAGNVDKESKLLAEVDAFGQAAKQPTLEDVERLPYLAAVLQEALRLLPPAPFTFREAKEDLQLGPYVVPKGAWIQTCMYATHRSARYWREPLDFMPERFLPGSAEAARTNLKAHMPFGEGARACPGSRFAMLEAKLALLRLYHRFTFRLAPGQQELRVRTAITLCPLNGINVTAHRRG